MSNQNKPMMKRNLVILGVTLLVIALVAVLAIVLPQQRKVSADAPVLASDTAVPEVTDTAASSPEATSALTEVPTATAEATATAEPTAEPTAAPTAAPTATETAEVTQAPEAAESAVQTMESAVQAAEAGESAVTATDTDLATGTDMATGTDLATGTDMATTTDLGAEDEVEAYLLVAMGNIIYQPIPLTGEADYTLTNKLTGAENHIHVTRDSIVMSESNCDGQDCLEQGEVTLSNRSERLLGNMIICLPHNITLELLTPAEAEEVIAQYSTESTEQ